MRAGFSGLQLKYFGKVICFGACTAASAYL